MIVGTVGSGAEVSFRTDAHLLLQDPFTLPVASTAPALAPLASLPLSRGAKLVGRVCKVVYALQQTMRLCFLRPAKDAGSSMLGRSCCERICNVPRMVKKARYGLFCPLTLLSGALWQVGSQLGSVVKASCLKIFEVRSDFVGKGWADLGWAALPSSGSTEFWYTCCNATSDNGPCR